MQKQISITQDVELQLTRLRIKYGDKEDNVKASYSRIIRKTLKKAKMWKE